ncbi:MAG: FIST N-terminal domain-containing protein [bacterium]
MKIGAAGAAGEQAKPLIGLVLAEIQTQLGPDPADLGFLFVTDHFADEIPALVEQIQNTTGALHLLGCTGESVIGPTREYENTPSLSLWMARLPGVRLESFYLSPDEISRCGSETACKSSIPAVDPSKSKLIMLSDPFTTDIAALFGGINQFFPGCLTVGGMASALDGPGRNVLIHNGRLRRQGTVGVAITGAVEIATVVSQGCRPIGQPLLISKSDRNIIHQLGAKPPLEVINELYHSLSQRDRHLLAQGLFVGRVIDEYQQEFRRGDFLIRNLMDADQESGAIAVMDQVETGTTIQFHVRDSESADEDLRALLALHAAPPPAGALLFSCNGRGTHLFPDPDHDVTVTREVFGPVPVAGFFCAGEFGPVGGKNFIHGHTASLALFRPAGQPGN